MVTQRQEDQAWVESTRAHYAAAAAQPRSEPVASHPHAENMRLYAEDAAETDKPWERWEFRWSDTAIWEPIEEHPVWEEDREYRRKTKPMECWVNVYTDNENGAMNLFAFSSKEAAKRDAMDAGALGAFLTLRRIAVHMHEVAE